MMPRRGAALIAVALVLALAAALLPGAALDAFYVPAFTFVVLAGERVNAPVIEVVLTCDQTARSPLDSRGPPRA